MQQINSLVFTMDNNCAIYQICIPSCRHDGSHTSVAHSLRSASFYPRAIYIFQITFLRTLCSCGLVSLFVIIILHFMIAIANIHSFITQQCDKMGHGSRTLLQMNFHLVPSHILCKNIVLISLLWLNFGIHTQFYRRILTDYENRIIMLI